MARRLRGALRRFAERLGNETVHERPCPECGEPVATEPAESGVRSAGWTYPESDYIAQVDS